MSVDELLKKTSNPHTIVSAIEIARLPYDKMELYHKAHNDNRFRSIDYFYLYAYSSCRGISDHAGHVLLLEKEGRQHGR